MQIKCIHGFFIFTEERVGEAADFMGLWDVELVSYEKNLTFKELENPPEYSIQGGTYLGAPAIKTFAGKPWEILKANNLIFNFAAGKLIQKSTVTGKFNLEPAGKYYLSAGLIMPGSIFDNKKVHSYTGFYSFDKARFRYSEVLFD